MAFATRLPMGSDRSSSALAVEGVADDGRTPPNRQVKVVSPGLFRTQGTPLVAGRDFTWTDLHDRAPGRDRLGEPGAASCGDRRRRRWGGGFASTTSADAPWWEVVGVAGDVHDDGVDRPPPATVYWPALPTEELQGMAGYQARRVSLALRTDRAGSASLVERDRRRRCGR